jgi:hypothetical protein
MNERFKGIFFRAVRPGGGDLPSPEEARKTFERNTVHPGESSYRQEEGGNGDFIVKEKGDDGYEEVWVPVRKP